MSELRNHKRRPVDVEFKCRDEAASGQLSFATFDVSEGGAFLKSDVLFEIGERLWLEFLLPGRTAPIRAEAKVAWVRRFPRAGEEGGMGVQFLGMAAEDRSFLQAFVDE